MSQEHTGSCGGRAHTVPRTGRAPLSFHGQVLAEANGRWQAGREHNRYHDLAVYQTARGSYVSWIAYRTAWQGEFDRDTAVVCDNLDGVARFFGEYDPVAVVCGYPDRSEYTEKQAALLASIRSRYLAQVSQILGELGAVEEVE